MDEPVVVDFADEELHRVAVVVFVNIRGLDYRDASNAATRAVDRRLRETPLRFVQGSQRASWDVPVEVAVVRSLSEAAGNGMLHVVPSAQAYRSDTRGPRRAGSLPSAIVEPRAWSETGEEIYEAEARD